jgi:hypothetical protein
MSDLMSMISSTVQIVPETYNAIVGFMYTKPMEWITDVNGVRGTAPFPYWGAAFFFLFACSLLFSMIVGIIFSIRFVNMMNDQARVDNLNISVNPAGAANAVDALQRCNQLTIAAWACLPIPLVNAGTMIGLWTQVDRLNKLI